MPMTMTEKILARAAGKPGVEANDIISCSVDLVCVDEIQIVIFLDTLKKLGVDSIKKGLTVCVIDHYCPPTSIDQARAVQAVRDFARSQGLVPLEGGIKHQLMMQEKLIRPGMVVTATDSHINTCGALGAFAAAFGPSEAAIMAATGLTWLKVPESIRCEIVGELSPYVTPRDIGFWILGERGLNFAGYKAVEFCGESIERMSLDGRITLANMSAEMGAKNAVIAADSVTEEYLKGGTASDYAQLGADAGARYADSFRVEVSGLEPLVAMPHSPAKVKTVSEASGTEVDQAFIGSCVGGNIEDLRLAASILKGRKVSDKTRLIITPASREIHLQAVSEGLIEIFLQANAYVSGMTCSVCVGLEALLLPGQSCISTSTRNFKGRMGSPEALIYLASPATTAASAVAGRISDARDFA